MERLAREFFAGDYRACSQFMRHKMFLISPSVLHEYGIDCHTVRRHPLANGIWLCAPRMP